MKQFLIKYRRLFTMTAMLITIGVMSLMIAGCGVPTWLTDANNIVEVVGTSIAAIGAFIAGLTGNAALAAGLAVIGDWITKIETGIGDIETLVNQYQAAPSPTLLSDITSALADVEGNIQQDFSNLGLPSGVLSVIAGIAALALSQLQAWGTLIPAAKATEMQSLVIKVPYTKAQYKEQVNKILSTPTGDAEIDAALAKVKKI